MWTVEYDNDDNGAFREWWCVTDGNKRFTTSNEKDAEGLKDLLNAVYENGGYF